MRDDELSAIIQFAPVALVVLDRNRNLKRVNKFAETVRTRLIFAEERGGPRGFVS